MITLTRLGTVVTGGAEDIARARTEFEHDHLVRFPGLLDAELLAFVQRQIERDGFRERVHKKLPSRPVDLALKPGVVSGMFDVITNDPRFLEFARQVTGRLDIESFMGVAHRRIPGAGHGDEWHSDMSDGRLVALTINLGAERFEGGVLQIQLVPDGPVVCEIKNDGPGDAVLFKLREDLKHRVTSPEGHVPRTVYAGWFRAVPRTAPWR